MNSDSHEENQPGERLTVAAVDGKFLAKAQTALKKIGQSAIDFLSSHPDLSKVELARRLNHGANAIGLVMALYDEANRTGKIRELAQELLFRQIRAKFPDGWRVGGSVDPIVSIGSWSFEIGKYGNDESEAEYAQRIIREFGQTNSPPAGWIPESNRDEYIERAFKLHWPVDLA